jgi:hypothetical protein
MGTVLEGCITEEQRSALLFFFFVGGVHKEMLPVYGGSVCRVKQF